MSLVNRIVGASGNAALVNNAGELYVVSGGHVSTSNSSTATLGANATFTGTAEEILDAAIIIVNVKASHASATNGMVIEYSPDGTNWDNNDIYTVLAATGKTFSSQPSGKYMRVRYTNGATPQTYFRLETIIKHSNTKPSSHRVQDTIIDDDDAELALAVLKLRTAQNNYVSGAATNNGNFKVSLEEYNGMIANGGLPTTRIDNAYNDAFSRQRVSATGQRFDCEFIYGKQTELIDSIATTGATVIYNSNSRDIVLQLGTSTVGEEAALYSHYDVPYTPGNGQLIDITGTLNNAGVSAGSVEIFFRSKVSGSVTETIYQQANWNKSTVSDVDWTKSQIIMMDFQSLKIGRIRFNLVRNGVPTALHEIYNDNIRNTGYWQSPSLPVAWRLYNGISSYVYSEIGYGDQDNAIGLRYKAPINPNVTLRAVCATVKSEGGNDLPEMQGMRRSVDTGTVAKTVSTTLVPIISLQVSSLFSGVTNRMAALVEELELSTDNAIKYALLYRPTLTGASFNPVNATYSGMNYDINATGVTNGIVIDTGYINTSTRASVSKTLGILGKVVMSQGRSVIPDILTLAAVRTSVNNASTFAAIKWKEIR